MLLRFLTKLPLVAVLAHAAAGEFTVESDVEYGRANGKPLLLDVYRPVTPDAKPRAGVIFVHGGGWAGGNKMDFRALAEQTARGGYVTFSINYRLVFGKENIWPAALDDCQRAVRWIRANSEKYQLDPRLIGAVGASAGGHLVALLGMIDTRDNTDLSEQSSRVKCVVNIFGPADLTESYTDKVLHGRTADALIRGFLGGTPEEKPEAARAASPLFQIDAKTAPFLTFHGGKDELVPVDQSKRLDAALKKAAIESTLVIFPNDGHGFGKANNDRATKDILAFFAKHLAR